MLGTLDRSYLFKILHTLAARDARALLQCVAELDERVPEYEGVLTELASMLQRLALLQAVPDFQLDEGADLATLTELAQQLSPEDVQLFYQIAIVGRRDLGLAPDPRSGFEMVLLRMLSFQLASVEADRAARPASIARTPSPPPPPATVMTTASPPPPTPSPIPTASSSSSPAATEVAGSDWSQIVKTLSLQGPVSQLAAHCTLVKAEADRIHLLLDAEGEHYRRPTLEEKLRAALSGHFGREMKLEIALATAAVATPARQQRAQADARQREAQVAIDNDPNVRAMRDTFGAKVQTESVRPVD
jgi:DNA polymerase-3 subunit gamma/tau